MKLFNKLKSNLTCKQEEKKIFSTLESIIDAREERGDSHVVDAHELWLMKNIFRTVGQIQRGLKVTEDI